ncbi:hypothetical protein [Nocardioides convexus]|uniref:hypothetical protein n=1 Tax=Nocardioides convexus TaxID=2712224 RepID=UPI00241876C2|nr:hypothetical protein [Nocardioides convexus]
MYGASEGLNTVVLESEVIGGQAGTRLDDPQLPRLPARYLGDAPGPACADPGDPLRRPLLHRLVRGGACGPAPTAHRTCWSPRAARCTPARCSSPPAWPTAGSASRRWRTWSAPG